MSSRRVSLLTSLLLLAGCGGGSSAGALTVLLKDAPANFDAAVVTISEVDLVSSSGVVVLSTTPTTTNLLDLANETATLVKDAVVPAGTYSQLRFVITGGYVQVGGVVYATSPSYAGLPPGSTVGGELQMPSEAQSGLKIDLPAGVQNLDGAQKIVLVDFDVSQSFGQKAGASGTWVMHPVVKATDLVMTGTLDVTLGLGPAGAALTLPAGVALTDFSAVLTPAAGGDGVTLPLASGSTGTVGATFKYLVPGAYTLTLTAPASVASFQTDPAAPISVTITSGQATSKAVSLTGVVAGTVTH